MTSDSVNAAIKVLARTFRSGECIPFIGSGLSADYTDPNYPQHVIKGLPTARDLLESLRKEVQPLIIHEFASLMQAFDVKETIDGARAVKKFIEKHIGDITRLPLPAHCELAKLSCPAILTTNWDNLIELGLQDRGIAFRKIVTDADVLYSEYEKILVIKPHGTIERSDTLIATTEETLSTFQKNKLLASQIRVLLAQRTILFLGYSLEDPDFRQLFLLLRETFGDQMPRSFAIQQNPDKHIVDYWQLRGVQVLSADATEFLQKINQQIHLNNSNVTELEPWIDDDGLRLFIGVESQPNEGRAIESFLEKIIMLLDSNPSIKIDTLKSRLKQVIQTILKLRPHHQLFRTMLAEIDDWSDSKHSIKEVRASVLKFKDSRSKGTQKLSIRGAGYINQADGILIYSNSTRIIDVVNEWLRTHENERLTLYVSECRPKSSTSFSDAMRIADQINCCRSRVEIRLIPDAMIGHLMDRRDITKVFFGAHSIIDKRPDNLLFTNTVGSLGIVAMAHKFDVPVFVFAEKSKFINLSPGESEPELARSEVHLLPDNHPRLVILRESGKTVEYENSGYDQIGYSDFPFHLVTESECIRSLEK